MGTKESTIKEAQEVARQGGERRGRKIEEDQSRMWKESLVKERRSDIDRKHLRPVLSTAINILQVARKQLGKSCSVRIVGYGRD